MSSYTKTHGKIQGYPQAPAIWGSQAVETPATPG